MCHGSFSTRGFIALHLNENTSGLGLHKGPPGSFDSFSSSILSLHLSPMATQVESGAPNQIPNTAQDWMLEEDLKSLPRAVKVNSLIFVRHLTETSFELNVNAPDNTEITRHILADMEGGRRFYEPGEGIRIRVDPYHRGEGYEFHIVDIDNHGRVLEHLVFLVDTKFAI